MELKFGWTKKGRPFLLEDALEVSIEEDTKVVIKKTSVLLCFWHGGPNSGGWDKYKAPVAVERKVRKMLAEGCDLDDVADFILSQFNWDWEWVSPCPWCYNEWKWISE